MAEGWAKHFFGTKHNFFSAGTEKHGLNSRAVKVMFCSKEMFGPTFGHLRPTRIAGTQKEDVLFHFRFQFSKRYFSLYKNISSVPWYGVNRLFKPFKFNFFYTGIST